MTANSKIDHLNTLSKKCILLPLIEDWPIAALYCCLDKSPTGYPTVQVSDIRDGAI